jgi:hypothetical protein
MKIAAMITIAALIGKGAQAGEFDKLAKFVVAVCMQTPADPGIILAQATATKMFAKIGVRLDWHRDQESCPSVAIRIQLSDATRRDDHPGALAFALPYEGLYVQVFSDRILQTVEAHRTPFLLAHVLVHEITHILQGCIRHSTGGIMKTRWDLSDYDQMAWKPMEFTEEDVRFIYLGLATHANPRAAIGSIPVSQ